MKHSVRITTAGIIAVLMSACHRTGSITPSSTPEAVTGTKGELNSVVHGNSWTITPTTDTHRYTITQTASTQAIESSTPVADTLNLIAQFSLMINRQGEFTHFSAVVDRFSTRQSARNEEFKPQLPVSISGRLESSKISLEPISRPASILEPSCTNGNLTLFLPVKAAVLTTPLHLVTGMNWIDSVSLPGCAGSVTTTTNRRSSYRVIGDTTVSGSDAILLELTETSTTKGDGSEGQHSVEVTATGSGTGRVAIDTTSGQVLKSLVTRTTELSMKASGRIHRFRQTLIEEVTQQGI